MKINLYSREGFTLIELLIVIALIGILVSVVVVAINPARLLGEANDSKKREELLQIKTALQLYFNDKTDYPPTVSLVSDLETGGYMRQVPTGYIYQYNSATDYYAGAVLQYPDSSDDSTFTTCAPSPGGLHYVVCPD